jgi:hypothetical protein
LLERLKAMGIDPDEPNHCCSSCLAKCLLTRAMSRQSWPNNC